MPIRESAALDLARKILKATGYESDVLVRLVASLIVVDVAKDETAQLLKRKVVQGHFTSQRTGGSA